MTIKEFTKNTIVEIVEGVIEANEALHEHYAFISASSLTNYSNDAPVPILAARDRNDKLHYVTNVDFDIAVSVAKSEEKEKGGGFKLKVLSYDKTNSNTTNLETASRVKFSLPLALPHNDN